MIPMPPRPIIAACLLAMGSTALAQNAAPPSRDARSEIEVLERGRGTPVVLRWRSEATTPITIQVTTRTVPAAVESPGLDDTEPDVRLAGFMRPPVEKSWMLQGRMTRPAAEGATSSMEANWRVTDAAARLVGVRPVEPPAPDAAPESSPEEGPSEAPPRRDDRSPIEQLVSPKLPSAAGSDPEQMARAIAFERITNESLQQMNGAAITQVLAAEGFVPGASTVRLRTADRRADFEASGLVSIMSLAEPALPSEPLGLGGSWRTRWTSFVRSAPVVVEAIWTIHAMDEAAATTGVAESVTLRVEYQRRIADGANISDSQRNSIEANGRGEVRTTLTNALRLEGRFVETPISEVPNRSTNVTRMRLTPIDPIR